jgi:hypothetical protein
MLACNRLRIDLGDGSPVVDYRIESGHVESRTVDNAADRNGAVDTPWQRLTADQLSLHVMADTVVSRWLCRRMGMHQLIWACNDDASFASQKAQEPLDRTAA